MPPVEVALAVSKAIVVIHTGHIARPPRMDIAPALKRGE